MQSLSCSKRPSEVHWKEKLGAATITVSVSVSEEVPSEVPSVVPSVVPSDVPSEAPSSSGGGGPPQGGAAQGKLQTLTVSSKTVPAGQVKKYGCNDVETKG